MKSHNLETFLEISNKDIFEKMIAIEKDLAIIKNKVNRSVIISMTALSLIIAVIGKLIIFP